MKQLLFMGVAILSALNAWAVQIPQQVYTDSTELPASFSFEAVRYDYRFEGGDTVLANTQTGIVVNWDRSARSSSGSYGVLTISNFYYTDCVIPRQVDITFNNQKSYNFKWEPDSNCIHFCFPAFWWSKQPNSEYSYAYHYNSKKYAFLGLVRKLQQANGSTDWFTNERTYYAWSGGYVDCWLHLDTKTIDLNYTWGCFMMANQYGNNSTVLEVFDRSVFREPEPTTLAWIEENGVANAAYTVADQLVGVYAQGGSLWCKDQGNISIEKSENPGCIDYVKRLMGSVHGMNPSLEWDQSNWVELDFGDVTAERALLIQQTYVGHTIAAGTITGTYADNLNHRIVVNADPEVDGVADYVPNYYCPVNFMDETVVTTDNNSYYFLNPKTQEYAMLTMAMWKEGDVFVVPAKDENEGVNTADFSGAFTVNWDLNAIPEAEIKPLLSTDEVYEFHAILRRNLVETGQDGTLNVNRVIGKDVTPIDKYLVFPIDLTANNTITGINDVKTESQPSGDGFYYNLAGQRVTNPTPGFYIHNGKKVIVR